MHEVTLFNEQISLKSETCVVNNESDTCGKYINLYTRLTNECNAHCKFCTFKGKDSEPFEFYKWVYAFRNMQLNMQKQGGFINKASFTGGEPTLKFDELIFCLEKVKKFDPAIFTVVNTNGIHLKRLLEYSHLIDSIALSRHHYNDLKNEQILGVFRNVSPTLYDLGQLSNSDKKKIHVSCNLIKGEIDSKEECRKYIEGLGNVGITDIGFVSLMDVNSYCTDHLVDFNEIKLNEMIDTMQSTEINKSDGSCRCANYLTSTDDGTIVKSYARYVCDRTKLKDQSTLVYDVNKLKIGFNGKTLFDGKIQLRSN